MVGRIKIKHMADIGHIQTARCHIGGHEILHRASAEAIKRHGARALVHVTMKGGHAKAVLFERFPDDLHIRFTVAENNAVFNIHRIAHEPAKRFALLRRIGRGGDEQLRDRFRRCGLARNLDADRIVQKRFRDALDFRRHCRREKQRLTRKRHHFADALNIGNKAHIEHTVGFVDH